LAVQADVILCALVVIITRIEVVVVETTQVYLTAVISADIVVIAGDWISWGAGSTNADITKGAYVIVRAWHWVVAVDTASDWIAAVICAEVTVITVWSIATLAGAFEASLAHRTCVAVIAGQDVVVVLAAFHRVTPVSGARVLVIAVAGIGTNACALCAIVTNRARIRVITLRVKRIVLTSAFYASVWSTDVAIIAIHKLARHAGPFHAVITHCAGIIVGARAQDVLILAATIWCADVLGAGVAVIAVYAAGTNALTADTDVIHGAGVVVIAAISVVLILAALVCIAAVVSADVVVIAINRGPAAAIAVTAESHQGASVAVIAGRLIIAVHATI
jgi:hypothetical protein